jgi:hypothetical protein
MKTDTAIRCRSLRALALPVVVAMGLFTTIGSGGGGGGGGGDNEVSDEPAKPLPSVVRYTAGSPASFSGSGVDIALDGGGTIHAGFYLEGSYAKSSRTYTLESHNVPRINVTTSGLPYSLLYGDFGILIEQPLQWVRGMHPTAGQFRTVPGDTVRLTVTADAGGTGQPGVDIAWIVSEVTQATDSLTWEQLDSVLNDVLKNPSAWPGYIVEAAFEYRVFQRVYDQIQIGMDGIEFVTVNDAALTAAGGGVGIDHACDLFPYNGSAGDFHFTWNDGPGLFADALGPGDNFAVTFHDCWMDEPGAADPWVRSGAANLLSYWEDQATITLGFDPVVLKDVVETATFEGGGMPTLGDTVTVGTFGVNGQDGFRLLTEPDTSAGINLTNAVDVASAGVASLLLPRQVGDLGLGILAGLVSNASFQFCDISGSVNVDPMPTTATAVPSAFNITFSACQRDPTDPVTLDGTVILNVESVTGGTLAALATNDYAVALVADSIAVQSVDAVGTSTLGGGSRFTRTAVAGDFAESSESQPGGLSIMEGGITRLLQPYKLATTLATSGAYTLGEAGDVLTADLSNQAGAITVTVVQPVRGTDPSVPVSGELRIVALDGSALTVTVANGNVTLDLDTNGDGTVDDTLTSIWTDLN